MIDEVKEAKRRFGNKAADVIVRDLNIQKWNVRQMKGLCPFHVEDTASFSWDPKNLRFHCFGCGRNYDIIDHYISLYGSFKTAAIKLLDGAGIEYRTQDEERKRPVRAPRPENNTAIDKAYQYLWSRGISAETCKYGGIKQDKSGNVVFEYYSPNGELGLVKIRLSREAQKGESKIWCQKDVDHEPLLYLMNKTDPTKPLLICEGEVDCLSAIEAGFRNSVSIPFGAGNLNWIEYNYQWLEQFESIILCTDCDQAGKKMISEVVPRLGEHRVRVVQW